MPVRIYDIAKKLGLESKEVLAKAKELGITAAKVPSSSLDKITAEYLEEQFGTPRVAAPAPVPAEPIVVIKAQPAPIEVPPEPPIAIEAPVEPTFTTAESEPHIQEPVAPAVVASEPEPQVEQAPEPVKSGVLEPVTDNLPLAGSTPPPAPQPPVVSP
ncbi:MAG: Translation initiation factor, partial [Verrucomicrobiales bacterium]|nr:Translation initiation factor [Verrucomicrobiales bacterium]